MCTTPTFLPLSTGFSYGQLWVALANDIHDGSLCAEQFCAVVC